MKIIISHDIDHIKVFEHTKDLILPKFIIRSLIEYTLGYISYEELLFRGKDFISNKWNNIENLIEFDKSEGIPSTFFIAVSRGRGLSYSLKDVRFWVKRILKEGFNIGLHGIAYEDYNQMKKEYDIFKDISGIERFGIRMHYLRMNNNTLLNLNKLGYIYDSSIYGLESCYKVGTLFEFPLCLMDGYIINKNLRFQNQKLSQIKEQTKKILDEAINKNLKYFTVLFHDRYFSESFITWKRWYIWLIEYLKENKFTFISFEKAVEEIILC